MKNVKLLDCTLRDGGYVNDWEFGHNALLNIFERLVNCNVDVIEVGFLDDSREFDINRSIMPTTDCIEKIFGKVDFKDKLVVGMIDFGTCDIKNIQPCSESYLGGIRVIFKKQLMHEAIAYCKQIKDLGYKVFTQLVSITSYNDEELLELANLVAELKPYAVSCVDTYGLLHQENLLHYVRILDQNLPIEIGIGYHSHNNFQMGYANSIEMLKLETERMLLVDGTLYGMGKSAGNTPLELLAMHLNEIYETKYDVSQMLEAIDSSIMSIYQEHPWGYNLFYYIAASNHCHPNYVQTLMDKHTLSIKSIHDILSNIECEKKLMFDKTYIDALYYEYQNKVCDDTEDRAILNGLLCNKEVMILGPGKTINSDHNSIVKYIDDHNPIVIAVNFIPEDIKIDYVFLSNPRRYIRLTNSLKEEKNKDVKVIATSNVTRTEGSFKYTLNNSTLLDQKAAVVDYSFIMLIKAMISFSVKDIVCAGFDGYSNSTGNYANPDMEYWFSRRKTDDLNNYVKNYLDDIKAEADIKFITKTYYINEKEKSFIRN